MTQHVHSQAHSSRHQHPFLMNHTSLHSKFHPLRAHHRKPYRKRSWDRRDTQTHHVPPPSHMGTPLRSPTAGPPPSFYLTLVTFRGRNTSRTVHECRNSPVNSMLDCPMGRLTGSESPHTHIHVETRPNACHLGHAASWRRPRMA